MSLGGLLVYLVSLGNWQEGWRIPFIILGLLSLLISGFRRQLLESPLFLQLQQKNKLSRNPIKQILTHYKLRLILIFTLCTFYCVTVYVICGTFYTYLSEVSPFGSSQAKLYVTLMQLEMACFMPIVGWNFSRLAINHLFLLGACAIMLMTVLVFMVATTSQLWLLLSILTLCALAYAIAATAVLRILYDLVPTTVRCTSVSVLYNVAAATFGGTTPLVTQAMLQHGLRYGPALYVGIFALVAMVVVFIADNIYYSNSSIIMQEEVQSEIGLPSL